MRETIQAEHRKLLAVWQQHTYSEFVLKDPNTAMAVMTEDAHVVLVASNTGGQGWLGVYEFYARRFLPFIPSDIELIPVTHAFARDRIVEESVVRFTHSVGMEWMLPGLEPTSRKVEFPLISVITFRGDKIASEHLYWDQATVLSQLGVVDNPLAAAGAGSANKLLRLGLRAEAGVA